MKKLLTILSLLLCIKSFSQTLYSQPYQRQGALHTRQQEQITGNQYIYLFQDLDGENMDMILPLVISLVLQQYLE